MRHSDNSDNEMAGPAWAILPTHAGLERSIQVMLFSACRIDFGTAIFCEAFLAKSFFSALRRVYWSQFILYDTWVAFVAASLLILIVPGPTLLVVVSYALRHGRRVIWPVAAAVSAGHALAISLAVWGLDALSSLSTDFPSGAQLAASVYLAFLGIRQFRSRATPGLATLIPASVPGRDIFMHTATATALNPCSIGFFIAVTPQLAQASAAPTERLVLFGVTFVILAALNTTAYCLLADRMQMRLARPESQVYLSRICGTALIGLALWSFFAVTG